MRHRSSRCWTTTPLQCMSGSKPNIIPNISQERLKSVLRPYWRAKKRRPLYPIGSSKRSSKKSSSPYDVQSLGKRSSSPRKRRIKNARMSQSGMESGTGSTRKDSRRESTRWICVQARPIDLKASGGHRIRGRSEDHPSSPFKESWPGALSVAKRDRVDFARCTRTARELRLE